MSGMSNQLYHFLDTTKKSAHFLFIFVLIVTQQMPNCGIIVLLYAFKTMHLFSLLPVVLCCFGKQYSENIDGHYIPITTCVNFDSIIAIFRLNDNFIFVTITDHLLLDLMELIVNKSM